MVWARNATPSRILRGLPTRAIAYDLAADFGADFAKLVTTGESPFGGIPALPPMDSIPVRFGGAPKYVACEAFGRFRASPVSRGRGSACRRPGRIRAPRRVRPTTVPGAPAEFRAVAHAMIRTYSLRPIPTTS